jgi:WD40 repeat protein
LLKSRFFALAFSPDGKLLAAAGWGDLMVWRLNADPDKDARRLPVANGGANVVAFSPNGKLLAAIAKGRVIHVWEVASWREVRRLGVPGGEKFGHQDGLAFLPDGKTLLSAEEEYTIRLWDVTTGKQVRVFAEKLNGLWTMALSPDGKTLATVQDDCNTLRLWDTPTGKEISRFRGPKNSFMCIAFSPDSRVLASRGGAGGEVRFWDAATGRELRRWTCPQGISRLAFAPDGKTLAVGGSGLVRFREVATGKDVLSLLGQPDMVTALTFSADGKALIAVSAWAEVVGFWEAATGKALAPLQNPPSGFSPLDPWRQNFFIPPALTRDGQRVASADQDRTVWVWEAATGKEISRFGGRPATYTQVAFAPDGRTVAVAHPDKTIRLWDSLTGQQLRQLGPHREEAVYPPVFSPDGKILATSHSDRTIRLWETATGKELRRLRWSGGLAPHLTFSPDGKFLASGHFAFADDELRRVGEEQSLLRIWDVATGHELHQFFIAWHGIQSVAFSPDGRTLAVAAAAEDGIVHLWEVASGKERCRFQGHRGQVMALAFSPDGRRVASGGVDRTAVVWDVTGLLRDGELRPVTLQPVQVERLWAELASRDAAKAYQALWTLVTAPRQAVPWLGERLRPVAAPDPRRLAQLITDLDNEQFAVREQATEELEKLGHLARPALRKALEVAPPLEVRQRVERLLRKLEGPVTSPDLLRGLRAIETLEQIDTREARQLLAALAKGAPEARLTQEAKTSLERVVKRSATVP